MIDGGAAPACGALLEAGLSGDEDHAGIGGVGEGRAGEAGDGDGVGHAATSCG